MRRRRTPEQMEELRSNVSEMYHAGVSPYDIASELEVSIPYIYQLLKQMGVDTSVHYGQKILSKLTDKEKDDIIEMYRDLSISVSQILTKYDIRHTQLYNFLRMSGIETRTYSNSARNDRERRYDLAVQLYKEGASLHAIFDETGVHQPTLHKILHLRGVQLRREASRSIRDNDPKPTKK